jgi:hypothetical protein
MTRETSDMGLWNVLVSNAVKPRDVRDMPQLATVSDVIAAFGGQTVSRTVAGREAFRMRTR